MSVQSEIQRLQTAKENILAAIASKNIVVPSGVTLDGAADLILQIENAQINKLLWQEILDSYEYFGTSSNTNNLNHIPIFGLCTLSSQDGVNYVTNYNMGYEYIASIGNIVINAGGLGYSDYDISFDNGVNWEYFVYPGFDESVEKCFVFNQKFFFTTTEGSIYYSSDGINWTRATNDGFYVQQYCTSPTHILAGSPTDGYYYSTDGDIWIKIDAEFDSYVDKIVYEDGYYFMFSVGKLYFSIDLINWYEDELASDFEGALITGITHFYWPDVLGNPISGWYMSTIQGIFWSQNITQLENGFGWSKYFDGIYQDITSVYNRLMAIQDNSVYTGTRAMQDWQECTPTNIQNSEPHFTAIKSDGTSFYIFGSGLLKAT